MKKLTTIALVLVMILTLAVSGAHADPEAMYGKTFPDFSVRTIDGETFTLSESLKTHDLVVINFWATWCGPCCMEFPYLQEAWEKYADRVDVIAMSVERTDTEKVLKSFAKKNDLTFPIGRDEKKLLDKMRGDAIPTTLVVDRDRKVVSVEIGAKMSVEEFTELFDSLLNEVPVEL